MNLNIDTAKKTMKKLSGVLVTYSTLIISVLILIALIMWGTNKLSLDKKNCKNMNALYKKTEKKLGNYSPQGPYPDLEKHRRIGDFFIKTAYNCCCAGNFKNDFVNLCALENCIKQGVRCLDFEIYSVDNEPVIAASSVNDNSVKETYNSIHFGDALNTIYNKAFSGLAPNPEDPLILNLRIMSKNKQIYNKMAKNIEKILGDRILSNCNSYNNQGHNACDIPIGSLIGGKVLILADFSYEDTAFIKKTKLWEFINLAGNDSDSPFYTIKRFTEVKHDDPTATQDYNTENMTMCIPDLSPEAKNFSYLIAQVKGCQLIGMCFQKEDAQLQAYIDFFNTEQSAFVRKDIISGNMLKVTTCIQDPPPQKNMLKVQRFSATADAGIELPTDVPDLMFST